MTIYGSFEADYDHEFLASQPDVAPADVLGVCAQEAMDLLQEVDWPEFGFDYRDASGQSDIHPVLGIDLAEPECLQIMTETAPMLYGVLSEVADRPTALENCQIAPVVIGRISINYAWGGLRSGWHKDYVPAQVTSEFPDRVSRVLYLTGSGRMDAITRWWHVAEFGTQGSLIELYNEAGRPLLHEGRTTNGVERIAVGFQQPARRLGPPA